MNLSWFDDFLTLAAIGNFSRAADERHMTQPAHNGSVSISSTAVRSPTVD